MNTIENDKKSWVLEKKPVWEGQYISKWIANVFGISVLKFLTQLAVFNTYWVCHFKVTDYSEQSYAYGTLGFRFCRWDGFDIAYILDRLSEQHEGKYIELISAFKTTKASLIYLNRYNIYWNNLKNKMLYGEK